MGLMSEDGKPIELKKKAVDESLLEEIVSMLPKEKVEATEPKNVLTKMMVEGRADKLLSLISTLLNTYIETDNYGSVNNNKTKTLVMTLMLEEKPIKEKTK
jgi:translation elongation factor EF-Ts